MRKTLTALAAATGIAVTLIATVGPAEARWGWRGGWGLGGAALGVGLGLALTTPYYIGLYNYYPYGWPNVAGYGYADCYLTRSWGPYGPRLVRVCY